jgi:hypothetical protein
MSGTTFPSSSSSTFLGETPGISRLYDNVQSTVPAVTLPMVQMACWNTIEDFYIRSTSRREQVNWQMAANVQQIDFNPYDENWLVAWILNVCGLSYPKICMPGLLIDMSTSTEQRNGTVLLALKPNSFNATFPDELFSQWFETILSGVLFRLYATPAKPYSSPQAAQFHGHAYRAGVASARDIAQRQYTQGPGRWYFPLYATGQRKN